MKTLLSLGLLLLTACCCSAMPHALQLSTAPRNCCFKFSNRSLPWRVQTIRGRKICYSGTFRWAVDVYNLLHNTEGSTQP